MVASVKGSPVSPAEYLAWERTSETKSEYFDGMIIGMAGASRNHNRISADIARSLGNQLSGKGCEHFVSDMRVHVPQCNSYFYPDVIVSCGEARFEDSEVDTLINPTLLVEVLSTSTERMDRVVKFDCYTTLESLTNYLLVAQDQARVECFTRQTDSSWRVEVFKGTEAVAPLPAIGCELRLVEIYARVRFAATTHPPDGALPKNEEGG